MSTQTWYSAKDLRSEYDARNAWTEGVYSETHPADRKVTPKANRAQVTTALDLIDIVNA